MKIAKKQREGERWTAKYNHKRITSIEQQSNLIHNYLAALFLPSIFANQIVDVEKTS
jgi:hypothetical protein